MKTLTLSLYPIHICLFNKMKYVFFGYAMLLVMYSCKNEEVTPKDYCPLCTSVIDLNGTSWSAKPQYSWYQISTSKDTFFTILINETNPTHDNYGDILLFWMIPYREGEFKLDSAFNTNVVSHVNFDVFEVEFGTPTQTYLPINDGSSTINLENINKNTGEFFLTFNLLLYAGGHPNATLHNSSYPNTVQFSGNVHGIVTIE